MYVLTRSSPRAPSGKVYWTGHITAVAAEGGETVLSPSTSLFRDDAFVMADKSRAWLFSTVLQAASPGIFLALGPKAWTIEDSETA